MEDQRLEINEQPVELYQSDPIGLTLRGNTLGKVGQIQAGFSNRFKVPRTRANRLALQNVEQINQRIGNVGFLSFANVPGIPYISLPARYYQNGVPILQRGTCIVEEVVEDAYILSVYGNNFAILDITGEATLQDIDYSSLDHLFNATSFAANVNNTQSNGFVYALLNYGGAGLDSDNIPLDAFPPCIYVRWLFDQIFSDITVQGDLYSDSLFNSLLIDLDKLQTDLFKGKALIVRTNETPYEISYPFGDILFAVDERQINVNDAYQFLIEGDIFIGFVASYFFECPEDGDYEVEYELDFEYNTDGNDAVGVDFSRTQQALSNQDRFFFPVNQRQKVSNTITLSRLAGERIYFRFTETSDVFINSVVYSASLKIENKTYPQGGQTDIGRSAHALKQSDLIQGIFQMFGVTPAYNEVTQVLELNYLEGKINNPTTAKDWSDKIDLSRAIKIESRIKGFSQLNTCNYLTEDTAAFNGSFTITDQTIADSSEYIGLPFAASNSNAILPTKVVVPEVLKYELNNASPARYEQATEKEPRIFYAVQNDPAITYNILDNSLTPTAISTFKQAVFVDSAQPRNLGFAGDNNLLDAQYPTLINSVLQYPRILTAYFKLSQVDVYDLDLPELVFIDVMTADFQAQGIFYINKIENYSSGFPAKVELIKVA